MTSTFHADTLGPPGRDWRPQFDRMLKCMLDIPRTELRFPAVPECVGTSVHLAEFKAYLPEIVEAVRSGSEWFRGYIQMEEERGADRASAIEKLWSIHPAGAATHQSVITAVRNG